MTRMLIIITAALALVWVPGQASRIGTVQVSAPAMSSTAVPMPNRFSGTALR